jgi:hypothetical protein
VIKTAVLSSDSTNPILEGGTTNPGIGSIRALSAESPDVYLPPDWPQGDGSDGQQRHADQDGSTSLLLCVQRNASDQAAERRPAVLGSFMPCYDENPASTNPTGWWAASLRVDGGR